MSAFRRSLLPATLVCLLATAVFAGSASAQSVFINGVRLVTSHPPVTMSGSMLLPMRDVFEALNSEVKWREADQRILATRGATQIELWIGRTTAIVNGEARTLPIAPSLIGGSTYVPLRFPAEAFGGEVKWDAGSRSAFIDIPVPGQETVQQPPTNPQPPAQPPVTPPVQPPVTPQPVTLAGTVIQVIAAPAGLLLQTAAEGGLQAVQLGNNTVLLRGVQGGAAQPVPLTAARAGDYAEAVLAPAVAGAQANLATRLTLTYGLAEGRIVAIAGNTIVLEDGSAFRLGENVRLADPDGQPLAVPLTAIARSTPGQLYYEPNSKVVYELRVAAAAAQPQPQQQPEILTVGLLNNASYFRRGDTLNLQLRGTPQGQARVSIERLAENLPLREVQPGVYQAAYRLETREDWAGLAVSGDLTVGGVAAETAVAPTRLEIDNTPPRLTQVLPADGAEVANTSPSIRVSYDDDQEAPIDRAASRLWVNGRDVTAASEVYADELDYVARNLRPGRVAVRVLVRDLAGNESSADWAFTVVEETENPVLSVFHEAGASLVGNVLKVIMEVANPGGEAAFNLGDLRLNLPMQRRGNTNYYEGTYTLQPGDRLVDAPVTVTYRDPRGRRGTLASTTRLNIDTSLPTALRITEPAEGAEVGEVIQAAGEAPANGRVRVTVSYALRGQVRINGQLWQGLLIASGRGLWRSPQVSSSLGALGRASEYTVLAELLEADGDVLSRQQVRLQPAATPSAVTTEGTVTRVTQLPPAVVLTLDGGTEKTISIGSKTVVTRGVTGGTPERLQLIDVPVGDYGRAVAVPGETASSLTLTYGLAQGKLASLGPNALTLDDGTRLAVATGLRVLDPAGKALAPGAVVKGSSVDVVFQPRSRVAYELRVTALPQPAAQPRIESLGLLNKGVYFKRGDTLNVVMKGTAGGTAVASLGRLVGSLPLPEVRPGVYQAAYSIVARQNLRSQPLSGELTVGGVQAPGLTSQARVIVDNTPPSLNGKLPADGATLANDTPTLVLSFESTGGAPVDLGSSKFVVADKDVTADVHLGDDRVVYQVQRLAPGPVKVSAEIRDQAGNVASTAWTFSVAPDEANPLRAVFHDACSTLVAGSILTVTARPATPGGVATFSLGKLAVDVPMKRKGEGEFYKGTYVVREGDEVKGALVRVSYRDPAGKQGTMDATAPVSIDTKLPAQFKLVAPNDGGTVGDTLTVTGQAPPDARVRVTVTYGPAQTAGGAAQASKLGAGQLWRDTVITGARGLWTTPEIGTGIGAAGRADRYTIVAELLDESGKAIQQRKAELHK